MSGFGKKWGELENSKSRPSRTASQALGKMLMHPYQIQW